MKYIVYLTTNKVNGKIYIGVHETENPDIFDGYLGCGAYVNKPSSYNKCKCHLHQAIFKYGPSNFYRQNIKIFDDLESALELENYLVDENFVNRSNTYNMVVGGGLPPRHDKKTYQFDLKGNLIKEWNSIKDITDHYKCNEMRIRMCVRDKRSFDNCYWSFKNKIDDISEYRLSSRGYVFQYNRLGELINTFENASIASLKLDINRDAIISSVFDRTLCHGYYFLKADDDIDKLLESKKQKKSAKQISVFRYTLDGKFDKEYNSVTEAANDLNVKTLKISYCIRKNKECNGFMLSYTKEENFKKFSEEDLKPVKVAQYNLDHELIKIWNSVSECKAVYPSCQKVCRKQRRSTNGFIFEYV